MNYLKQFKSMKKNSLFLGAIIIAIISVLSSCKKDDVSPTISFTNQSAKDSIYFGESFTITGVASTTGKLSMIQFFRIFPYIGRVSEVEVAETKITSFASESSADFSAVIPNIVASIDIRVVVTDQNGQETSSVFSIIRRYKNIAAFTNINLGGWDSNYGSCLDVETGTAMSGSAPTNDIFRPKIDAYFEDAKLGNVDLDSAHYDNINRLPDTGIRFATTTFTPADYDAMNNDDLFKDLVGTLKIVPVKLNDVVFFTAKSGKKGLLRVSVLTGPTKDLKLDEKIQK